MRTTEHRSKVIGGFAAAFVAVAVVTTMGTGGSAAEGPELPGMCNGRTDSNVVVNAHANSTVKYILNVSTDAAGVPSGVLILSKGAQRVYVDEFCRVWQHLPGQEPGGGGACEEGDVPEGAAIVHAVGIGQLRDGTRVLVRTDARETEEGAFFRVRYREMGGHDEEHPTALAHDDEGCSEEDESWTRVPSEGWAPLKLFNLRVIDA